METRIILFLSFDVGSQNGQDSTHLNAYESDVNRRGNDILFNNQQKKVIRWTFV